MDSRTRTGFFWAILSAVGLLVVIGGSVVKCSKDTALLRLDHDEDGYCEHEELCAVEGVKPGDCDDAKWAVHPDMPEGGTREGKLFGDGLDNNCDGKIDEGAVDVDNDGDGFCEIGPCLDSPKAGVPTEASAKAGDCNDADQTVFPGAYEDANTHPENNMDAVRVDLLPDGKDNDCDGKIDEGTTAFDDDSDGFCESGPCLGSAKAGDCNDLNPKVFLGAPEGEVRDGQLYGDGLDNNCDGKTDEGAVDVDNDNDGFCEIGPCFASAKEPGDCDDANDDVYPRAPEGLDGLDNDCDGVVDNRTAAFDDDGDGFCEKEPCLGSAKAGDCNDLNPKAFPGAPEGDAVGNGDQIDNDCDGVADEGTNDFDGDSDKQSRRTGDCDDTNPLVFKGAAEWLDGFDNDCDDVVDEADGLAKLSELPRVNDKVPFLTTFNVYPAAVFDKRPGWAYDYNAAIASVDFVTGQVRLIKGREEMVTLEKSDYFVESVLSPYMALRKRANEGVSPHEVQPLYLLRFEQREFPLRVAVTFTDPPRPGVEMRVGFPVDTLNSQSLQSFQAITSPGTVFLTNATGDHVRDAFLFFSTCQSRNCRKTEYLGQLPLAAVWPGDEGAITASHEISVSVEQVETYDFSACQNAYKDAKEQVRSNTNEIPFEEIYYDLNRACRQVTGTRPLSFTVTYTR